MPETIFMWLLVFLYLLVFIGLYIGPGPEPPEAEAEPEQRQSLRGRQFTGFNHNFFISLFSSSKRLNVHFEFTGQPNGVTLSEIT